MADAVSMVLSAMRWAFEHADDQELGTDLQERMRQRYDADFDAFVALYTKLEKEEKAGASEDDGEEEGEEVRLPEVDQCEEMAEQWLRENAPD